MEAVSLSDIAKRFEENPLLIPKNTRPSTEDMIVKRLLNPAVFRFEKKTWLLVQVCECPEQTDGYVSIARLADGELEILKFAINDPHLDFSNPQVVRYEGNDYPTSLSHLRLMCSDDGTTFLEAEDYGAISGQGQLETYGIEDCRVAEINGIFYLTYAMVSPSGVGIGMMQTRDWKRFDRKGMILPPHNKDCAIFEEKIKDKYFALHQPSGPELDGNCIWLAESPDCVHWGNHKRVAKTRDGMWDSVRIAPGCSPIHTPEGWLAIYHGVDEKNRCSLGALLLDISNPSHVIARSKQPVMKPEESYEINDFSDTRIFTNGHLVIGDRLRFYYGARNEVICGAELSIQEILGSLSAENN